MEDEIINYLVARGFATQQGVDIFRAFLPDDDDLTGTIICVRDTGGVAPDNELAILNPTFQIFIRADTYDAGNSKLIAIRNALHQFKGQVLGTGTIFFFFIHAQSSGGYLGRDEKGRDTFSINFIGKTR